MELSFTNDRIGLPAVVLFDYICGPVPVFCDFGLAVI